MIEFKNVSKVYDSGDQQIHALTNINLTIGKGDIYGVIGYSGAGKSTLIRTVNLLECPTGGEVLVDGQNLSKLSPQEVREARKKIGMIFQHFNLLNSKTVFDNVAMPLRLSKHEKAFINTRVMEILRFVGLEEKAGQYPDELSGGQKQRVGIARSLATNPSILLCDEATSALDPETTKSILKLLKRVNEEYRITILMITHQMEVIKEICDKVAVMEDGKVIEAGDLFSVFTHPKTETTRNFIKSAIDVEIPQSVYRKLSHPRTTSRIFKMQVAGDQSKQHCLSTIARRFEIDVSILFGSITELQGIPFGNLIFELKGDDAGLEQAFRFLQGEQVDIKEVTGSGYDSGDHADRDTRYALHG